MIPTFSGTVAVAMYMVPMPVGCGTVPLLDWYPFTQWLCATSHQNSNNLKSHNNLYVS